jgi:hypothetical protein
MVAVALPQISSTARNAAEQIAHALDGSLFRLGVQILLQGFPHQF